MEDLKKNAHARYKKNAYRDSTVEKSKKDGLLGCNA